MISRDYKNLASKTSHWLKRESSTPRQIKIIKKHLKKLESLPKVLDIGCAEGENTFIFTKHGFNAYGVDYNKKLLNLAKKKYPSINFSVGNVEKLKNKNEQFDLSYCINTLFYTNLDKSVPEIMRITKKGGLAFLTLDLKITDLEKQKVLHVDSLVHLKKIILGLGSIIYLSKKQRTDFSPFKHKHVYYEVLVRKI